MAANAEVVIFCPLPPKPNGIADYLAEQLPYLSEYLDVTVVIENHAPAPEGICPRTRVLRLAEYLASWQAFNKVPHLYHVGNNPDTVYMLEVLLSRPGITVVHDLNLHYLIDLTNLSQGDKEAYTKALTNQYGVQGKVIGEQLASHGWKGQFMPHELMMHSSIIDASSQIIVHSEYSANKIAALGHSAITLIPHHLSPSIRHFQPKLKMTYRGELGLPGNKVVITSMGFIAKAKQIKAVLNSLAELKAQGLDFVYVLAGQCKPHEYDVYQDIADSGLADHVVVTGFLDEQDFFKYLLASDFIINLRYPTGGESSGTLSRAMGLGLGCIVVNIGPFAEIPDECAIKLDYNESFESNLTASIKRLVENPVERVTLGLNARRWVERSHNIVRTTAQYREVIAQEQQLLSRRSAAEPALPAMLWRYLAEPTIARWLVNNQAWTTTLDTQTSGVLWWLNNTVPVGVSGPVLLVGDATSGYQLLTDLFGYAESALQVIPPFELEQPEGNAFPASLAELAIVVIPTRAIECDPVRYFAALSERLALGAKVSVTVQPDNLASPDVPITRADITQYLEASGFQVDNIHTGVSHIDMNNTYPPITHEEWCFELTKVSWMINATPQAYGFTGISELKWLQPAVTTANGRGVL
ncbi:MAG TPA: hypothetical protein DGF36_04105 [Alteromonas sp.]|nr:hypothetical protein [Alteromonas sp.]|tara:strand:+ start:2828 stop:4750 length:1923 start_codon:yes stop_codon:yes gene_type:complete